MLPRKRTIPAAVMLTVLGAAILGCAPAAEPEPEPAFASDEEAFAAAEEVYRAYNAAGNARRSGDDSPDPQAYLVGEALEGDIQALNAIYSSELRLTGDVRVVSFNGLSTSENRARVAALVCLDAAGTRVIDPAGLDVTPAGRGDALAQVVEFVLLDESFVIARESEAGTAECLQ